VAFSSVNADHFNKAPCQTAIFAAAVKPQVGLLVKAIASPTPHSLETTADDLRLPDLSAEHASQ
jgi:hypothetical protein